MRRLLLPFILAFCLSPPALRAELATFDFEERVFYEPGIRIKDHSILFHEGIFHLYYIRGNEKSFGFATSPDLVRWTIHDPVFEAGPDHWDAKYVWAPCIVRYPVFPFYTLMYYTGVNPTNAQRTCLAFTSPDPSRWSKADSLMFPPFHADTSWVHWTEDGWSDQRDPCFLAEGDTCYLVNTVYTKDGRGALALARSTDYLHWADAGPLYLHNNSNVLESPFLLERDGLFHLFFTEMNVGGISHMSAPTLTGSWNILTRRVIDGGHAVEIVETEPGIYVFSRHTAYTAVGGDLFYSIRFDTLGFDGSTPEVAMTDLFDQEWTVLWGDAFDTQPVMGNNPGLRGDDTTVVGFEDNWWIGTYEAFNGPQSGMQPGAFQGDAPRGAVRSRSFRITGSSMRLLVGGGCKPDSCYVALVDDLSGQILFRETGCGTDQMDERIWNLFPWRGRSVHLEIVDDSSAPMGHINIDGIVERVASIVPPPDDGRYEVRNDKGVRKPRYEPESGGGPGGGLNRSPGESPGDPRIEAAVAVTVSASPNPFNPVTTISLTAHPDSRVTVEIYSVRGASIAARETRTGADGSGSIRWDGRDRDGAMVPSGIYLAAVRDSRRVLATTKLVLVR